MKYPKGVKTASLSITGDTIKIKNSDSCFAFYISSSGTYESQHNNCGSLESHKYNNCGSLESHKCNNCGSLESHKYNNCGSLERHKYNNCGSLERHKYEVCLKSNGTGCAV